MILQVLAGMCIFYAVWSVACMERNVRRARTMGIPLIRIPVDLMNITWLVFEPLLFLVLDYLPFTYGNFGRYSRKGWQFADKSRAHQEHGPLWAIVTPRNIYVFIADPDAVNKVFARRLDFLRPAHLYKMLEVYGPNVSTVGVSDWQQQRKILASPFNEATNKLVWTESLSQARDMLRSWTECDKAGVLGVAQDTRTLSLNVLAVTGFRRSYKFQPSSETGFDADKPRDYRDALKVILDNAVLMMMVSPKLLSFPIMPKRMKRIGQASVKFRQYMMDMLNEETDLLSRGEPGTGTLMTSFVRAHQSGQKKVDIKDAAGSSSKGLTTSEILGNLFIINFAGHDTTATVLAFGVLLFAAYPDIQDWVAEELQEFIRDDRSETWSYKAVFPRLKRCQAVLLETLRLFPPVPGLGKWTNEHPQPLKLSNGETLSIPARTAVILNLYAIHTHPVFWGEDVLEWRPSRWITNATASKGPIATTTNLAREELFVPRKGTYFPWSDGPQNCPGKAFSQVEWAAVIACLLRDHRVRPVLRPDETFQQARKRILAITEDCELTLLLRMRNADSVKLIWERV